VKILKINGIEPTPKTIADGSYPVSGGVYAVYRKGEKNPNVYKAVDFMLSPDGQKIVEKSGYIPVQ
jgi:phosphate transport system substrate-binding protein